MPSAQRPSLGAGPRQWWPGRSSSLDPPETWENRGRINMATMGNQRKPWDFIGKNGIVHEWDIDGI